MRETGQTNGETLKPPERVARDTKRLRRVRISIVVLVAVAAAGLAFLALQFVVTRMG
jgi:hypothetical protein